MIAQAYASSGRHEASPFRRVVAVWEYGHFAPGGQWVTGRWRFHRGGPRGVRFCL